MIGEGQGWRYLWGGFLEGIICMHADMTAMLSAMVYYFGFGSDVSSVAWDFCGICIRSI